MEISIRRILDLTGYGADGCAWCNNPDISVTFDLPTFTGQVDCNDCGARYQRFDPQDAIAWAAESLALAVRSGMTELARDRFAQVVGCWMDADASPELRSVWMNVRAGSTEQDDDACPF